MKRKASAKEASSPGETALARATTEASAIHKRFADLLRETSKENPDPETVSELRRLLDEHRGLELWRKATSIAKAAEDAALASTNNAATKEVWTRELEAIRAEHGYAESPAVERLLIHQIALCWFRLNLTEIGFAAAMKAPPSVKQGMYWERRLTLTQRRYLRAVESLARVRRLSYLTRPHAARFIENTDRPPAKQLQLNAASE
jgi:hypothetical protein